MATVSYKGTAVRTCGELPAVGRKAPDFRLVDTALQERSLADFRGRKKLLVVLPSVDTGVCAACCRKFDALAREREDLAILVVSADLPFAQRRFCEAEGIDRVTLLSMMRSRDFARDYGLLMTEGPLAGLPARAVLAVDEDDRVVYTELVRDLAQEPHYAKALAAL
ncbi:MAG: thiol peroxidase [Gammaproteobacteria bacterium]|nr:MAG: thiol peroxidase [Gammaproteobacteria bacterium]